MNALLVLFSLGVIALFGPGPSRTVAGASSPLAMADQAIVCPGEDSGEGEFITTGTLCSEELLTLTQVAGYASVKEYTAFKKRVSCRACNGDDEQPPCVKWVDLEGYDWSECVVTWSLVDCDGDGLLENFYSFTCNGKLTWNGTCDC